MGPPQSPSAPRKLVGKERRQAFFDAASALAPFISVRSPEGLVFFVSTADRGVGASLFVKRRRGEMGVIRRVARHLKDRGIAYEGTVLIDIGANIGTTSLTALQLGFGRVIAFEPEPQNCLLLRLNAIVNEFEHRVDVIPTAVGREDGTAVLIVSASNSGAHSLVATPEADETRERREVPVLNLDGFLRATPLTPEEVGLLWMDAQGAEGDILAGAGVLLGRPLVLEFSPAYLKRAGTLEATRKLLGQAYDEAIDLRSGVVSPAAKIPLPESSFTDLLLIRRS